MRRIRHTAEHSIPDPTKVFDADKAWLAWRYISDHRDKWFQDDWSTCYAGWVCRRNRTAWLKSKVRHPLKGTGWHATRILGLDPAKRGRTVDRMLFAGNLSLQEIGDGIRVLSVDYSNESPELTRPLGIRHVHSDD